MKKNYYVLYKAIRNENGEIIDCQNVPITDDNGDFLDITSYKIIRDFLHCINRDIIKIVNNNIDNLENIKTYKNYFIIKE